jgi:hypothetical protein
MIAGSIRHAVVTFGILHGGAPYLRTTVGIGAASTRPSPRAGRTTNNGRAILGPPLFRQPAL